MNSFEKILAIISFIGIMICGTSILVSCQITKNKNDSNNNIQDPPSIYSDTIIPSLGDDYK